MPSSQLGSIQMNSSLTRLELEVEIFWGGQFASLSFLFSGLFFKALSTQDAVRKHLKSPELERPRLQNMTCTHLKEQSGLCQVRVHLKAVAYTS